MKSLLNQFQLFLIFAMLAFMFSCCKGNIRNKKIRTYTYSNADSLLKVQYTGKIVLNGDLTAIKDISDNGILYIEQHIGSDKKELSVLSSGSNLEINYYVGNKLVNSNSMVRKFLEDMLPKILNNTDVALEQKVNYYHENDREELIDLFDNIENDQLFYSHFQMVLKKINAGEIEQILKIATNNLETDKYMSLILRSLPKDYFLDYSIDFDSFINAFTTIESDSYMAEVLEESYLIKSLNFDQKARLLKYCKLIEADIYMFRVLNNFLEVEKSEIIQKTIIKQSHYIESDDLRGKLFLNLRKPLSQDLTESIVISLNKSFSK